ncbi:hypothetical protein BGW38_002851 [Lunasporangiospora selenospora]|uniref:Uncharacterized protein n=1 Tax=Lunasporangiospora selenospora TaxID=979761 RepID=A0A9P6KD52_9FUNG|nr:hypothetical protein BGW38_002851 [Lunasporangiospora selenospora]
MTLNVTAAVTLAAVHVPGIITNTLSVSSFFGAFQGLRTYINKMTKAREGMSRAGIEPTLKPKMLNFTLDYQIQQITNLFRDASTNRVHFQSDGFRSIQTEKGTIWICNDCIKCMESKTQPQGHQISYDDFVQLTSTQGEAKVRLINPNSVVIFTETLKSKNKLTSVVVDIYPQYFEHWVNAPTHSKDPSVHCVTDEERPSLMDSFKNIFGSLAQAMADAPLTQIELRFHKTGNSTEQSDSIFINLNKIFKSSKLEKVIINGLPRFLQGDLTINSKNIKTLALTEVDVSWPESRTNLRKLLEANKFLKNLTLSKVGLNDDVWRDMQLNPPNDMLKSRFLPLSHLNLSRNNLGPKAIEAIQGFYKTSTFGSRSMGSNSQLVYLNLSENRLIGESCDNALMNLWNPFKLQKIYMTNTGLERNAEYMLQTVSFGGQNKPLLSNLTHIALSKVGLNYISRVINEAALQLQSLVVDNLDITLGSTRGNYLEDYSSLCDALRYNKKLYELSIKLDVPFWYYVEDELRYGPYGNFTGDRNYRAINIHLSKLNQAIQQNNTLRRFYLPGVSDFEREMSETLIDNPSFRSALNTQQQIVQRILKNSMMAAGNAAAGARSR